MLDPLDQRRDEVGAARGAGARVAGVAARDDLVDAGLERGAGVGCAVVRCGAGFTAEARDEVGLDVLELWGWRWVLVCCFFAVRDCGGWESGRLEWIWWQARCSWKCNVS